MTFQIAAMYIMGCYQRFILPYLTMLSLTGFATVLALALLAAFFYRRSSRLPLPPGPTGYPVIGHALSEIVQQKQNWIETG